MILQLESIMLFLYCTYEARVQAQKAMYAILVKMGLYKN